jgi:putative restriction endonuclease
LDTLAKYLHKFDKLRIDRSHGIAPHKPILLLSILQTYQNNLYNTSKIYITPELVAFFKTNWNLLVTSNHNPGFALPFYHLTSDKFWKLIPKPGFENILQFKTAMRSFSNLNASVSYALIDDELFKLMQDNKSNNILKQFLLDKFFPDTKENFNNSSNAENKLVKDLEGKILRENSSEYRSEIKKLMEQQNEEEIFLRGCVFKREIPRIYNNTCCISGMRIDATVSVTMIDACHIIPFSVSYDDTITNGIALCPNLHRAFDRGLISIDSNFRVIVSKSFKEDETNYSIKVFEGKKIKLPRQKEFFPTHGNFEWHQKNIFNH